MAEEKQTPSLNISAIDVDQVDRLLVLSQDIKRFSNDDYLRRCLISESREILIASENDYDAGYCILNWQPKYAYFRHLGIAEIQTLVVDSTLRRRGIASALIACCEDKARAAGHKQIGIGVGLHSGFGAAQSLYVKRGYVPDGQGVTYDREIVAGGEFRPVDDQLCLMMIKAL